MPIPGVGFHFEGAGWWGEEGIAVVILKDDPHVFLDFELKHDMLKQLFLTLPPKQSPAF